MEEHKKVIHLLNQKSKLSFTDIKRLFFMMKTNNLRFSDAIIEIGLKLTKNYKNQLSNDYYLVLQELFQAYIDLNLIHPADVINFYRIEKIIKQVLKNLSNRFPKSERVQRLRGILLESNGNYDDALVIYENMIKENMVDQATRKRRIALLRKKGEIDQAIQQLNAYLTSFPQDNEAWLELADIYLEALNFTKALFCYEELLILNPIDQHYTIKIAELYYIQGGSINLDLAKNYYCFALSKNAENTRALWGLLQTLKKIVTLSKSQKQDYKELAEVTILAIKKCYEKSGSLKFIENYPFEKVLNQF